MSDLRRAPRPVPAVLAGLALLLAYVAASGGLLLYSQRVVDPGIWADLCPLPWLAEGIAVSAMLLGGIRLWPAILVGSCLVWGGIRHDPPIAVLIDAAGEALSLVLIVHLLRLWRFHRRFDRLRDPFLLIGAALIGRLVAGNIDVVGPLIAVWLDRDSMPPDFLNLVTLPGVSMPVIRAELLWTLARWELNSVVGIVLAVPVLVASRQPLKRALKEQPAGLAWFAALASLWCVLSFTVPYAWASWPLLLLALMLVSWAAINFGVMTAALCTLALCCATAASFCQRVGPLARTDVGGGLAVVWGFIALLCCAGPVLATTLAARRRDLRRLTALAEHNFHIFMGNPCPAWVTETASGRIIHANDEATRRYGYTNSEFLAMEAGALLAEPVSPVGAVPTNADLIAKPFVKHRTSDGRVIDVEVVSTALELTGRAVTLTYAIEMTDRQDLRRRLLAVADRERRRLAQELHDGLGQILTGLALGSQSLLMSARRGVLLDKQSIAFTEKTAAQAETLLSQMTEGISPLEALNGDLVEALRRLPETLPPAERARMTVVVDQQAPLDLSLERREHLYRIAQEAIANALKHAQASTLTLRLQIDAHDVRVLIEDNGVGIGAPRARKEGLGIRSMKLRAQALVGEFAVAPRPGGGTTVSCSCSQIDPEIVAPKTAAPTVVPRLFERRRERPRSALLRDIAKVALITLACCAGAAFTMALAAGRDPRIGLAGARLAIPSLMSGAAAAGLIYGGRRLWFGPFLGVAVSYVLFQHAPWGFAIIAGAITTAGSWAIATALRRWHFTLDFVRWQDPILLVVVSAAVFVVTELAGVSCLVVYAHLQPGSLGPGITALLTGPTGEGPQVTTGLLIATVRWWADGFSGIVLVVPAVVAAPALWKHLRGQPLEAGLWLASVAAWCVALLGITDARALMPLLALGILILIWAASRFGVALACVGTLVCAMTGAAGFALQRGALATADPQQGVLYVWGFLGVLTSISLFITALLGERDRSRQNTRVAGEWYQRLFDSDPRALWVHDAETGRVIGVNRQALRTFGYGTARFAATRLDQLVEPRSARILLAEGRAPTRAPVEIRHRTPTREVVDLDVSFLASSVGGRQVHICFAQDVTERNALRRSLVEQTDVERRRLAAELRAALADSLQRLRAAVAELDGAIERGAPTVAILESITAQVRQATMACRECAHRASPLQASDGDFVVAMQNLYKYVSEDGASRVSITANLEAPLDLSDEQAEHLYELVREAVTQCVAREPQATIDVQVSATTLAVQVAVASSSPTAQPSSISTIGRGSAIRLRAMAMDARLWAQSGGAGPMRLVCECLNASAA